VSAAVVHGNAQRLLAHHPLEHPVALQLGGSDPGELEEATRIATAAGFAEINLNAGCPSGRVQKGAFGACLMLRPALVAECVRRMVAECVRRMRGATHLPVSVKCRIGIDQRDDYEFFAEFAAAVADAGASALIVHARAAILGGLTPKENREIPPLKYEYAYRLKRERPALALVLNGGIAQADAIAGHFARGLDGVMLGRAAYHRPELLAELERSLIDREWRIPEPRQILERLVPYARARLAEGVRLHAITRHLHGLMAGRDGARAWRRFLTELASRPDAAPETLFSAFPLLDQGLAA
jgi:tRNA-dihydrouridine synthase A